MVIRTSGPNETTTDDPKMGSIGLEYEENGPFWTPKLTHLGGPNTPIRPIGTSTMAHNPDGRSKGPEGPSTSRVGRGSGARRALMRALPMTPKWGQSVLNMRKMAHFGPPN